MDGHGWINMGGDLGSIVSTIDRSFGELQDLNWHLDIAGSPDRDPDCTRALEQQIHQAGLRGRIDLLGELEGNALEECFHRSDLLVHTASFEAYGMALTEALARGLPVVSTPAGALDDLQSPAIEIVDPIDPHGLARALRPLLTSAEALDARRRWARNLVFPDWNDQAHQLLRLVLPHPRTGD